MTEQPMVCPRCATTLLVTHEQEGVLSEPRRIFHVGNQTWYANCPQCDWESGVVGNVFDLHIVEKGVVLDELTGAARKVRAARDAAYPNRPLYDRLDQLLDTIQSFRNEDA